MFVGPVVKSGITFPLHGKGSGFKTNFFFCCEIPGRSIFLCSLNFFFSGAVLHVVRVGW